MKHLLVIIVSVLVLVFGSAGISNAASRSENNRSFAAGVYIHVKAMKWQRGRNVGTVTVKIDRNKGKVFYEDREIIVYENPEYISWDDSDPDPRTKYHWRSLVPTYGYGSSFYLYFNYDFNYD